MNSPDAQIVNYAEKRRRRGLVCLLWAFGAFAFLLVAGIFMIGAVYAGWTSGLTTARAGATATAETYAQEQCDRIPDDLGSGRLSLARSRFADLASWQQTPACLPLLAPTATAAYLASIPSPTPFPTATPAPIQPTIAPSIAVATERTSGELPLDYDLDALLAEATSALSLHDYPAAIDTLDAIISVDGDFQRELVRRLFLDALTAQALALYRSGRLSEAIVMTDRAEEHGSIEDLYHERYIALLYLDGQRYKATNPAEAVRKFSSMYYEFGVRDYVNGSIAGDLQEALRNYAMALALQGDHCPAQTQFEAALELTPAYGRVNRADLVARRDQSAVACQQQQAAVAATAGVESEASPQEIGVRAEATPAPVGQTG